MAIDFSFKQCLLLMVCQTDGKTPDLLRPILPIRPMPNFMSRGGAWGKQDPGIRQTVTLYV